MVQLKATKSFVGAPPRRVTEQAAPTGAIVGNKRKALIGVAGVLLVGAIVGASIAATSTDPNQSNPGEGSDGVDINGDAPVDQPVYTESPTGNPTGSPTQSPVDPYAPSSSPSNAPTRWPTNAPTKWPTNAPSDAPTHWPTNAPTKWPTNAPSASPTNSPTSSPTSSPTTSPTSSPTYSPTASPTSSPTYSPTTSPTTQEPTVSPTSSPTDAPTPYRDNPNYTAPPTLSPTNAPTESPTKWPTKPPTFSPTSWPTTSPTNAPTESPTKYPTYSPTSSPTTSPTSSPTTSPTTSPTASPTTSPTYSPTESPTKYPTTSPTSSPTDSPTESPTKYPTVSPTNSPTKKPTASPTDSPTKSPTPYDENPDYTSPPTMSPTDAPSTSPTYWPTNSPTTSPTDSPTTSPTGSPTKYPTTSPTSSPTDSPTVSPTDSPTVSPTNSPTKYPTVSPTDSPTLSPTPYDKNPDATSPPTDSPTVSPTKSPTDSPTVSPTDAPTDSPTFAPTKSPIAEYCEAEPLKGFCRDKFGSAGDYDLVCKGKDRGCEFSLDDCWRACSDASRTCVGIEYKFSGTRRGYCEVHYRRIKYATGHSGSTCYKCAPPPTPPPTPSPPGTCPLKDKYSKVIFSAGLQKATWGNKIPSKSTRENGDAICQAAQSAHNTCGRPGLEARAFVSISSSDQLNKWPGIADFKTCDNGKVYAGYEHDSVKMANSWQGLWQYSDLTNDLDTVVAPGHWWWSGTKYNGKVDRYGVCSNGAKAWSSTSGRVIYGQRATTSRRWVHNVARNHCNASKKELLCVCYCPCENKTDGKCDQTAYNTDRRPSEEELELSKREFNDPQEIESLTPEEREELGIDEEYNFMDFSTGEISVLTDTPDNIGETVGIALGGLAAVGVAAGAFYVRRRRANNMLDIPQSGEMASFA